MGIISTQGEGRGRKRGHYLSANPVSCAVLCHLPGSTHPAGARRFLFLTPEPEPNDCGADGAPRLSVVNPASFLGSDKTAYRYRGTPWINLVAIVSEPLSQAVNLAFRQDISHRRRSRPSQDPQPSLGVVGLTTRAVQSWESSARAYARALFSKSREELALGIMLHHPEVLHTSEANCPSRGVPLQ